MKEIWKDIKGYEGLYQVSNLGRVKALEKKCINGRVNKEKVLKSNEDNMGYKYIGLTKNLIRKYYKVHRLVALTFIPNPNNYPCVNHKDENKVNNIVDNLEWCTHRYNANYGTSKERSIEKQMKKVFQYNKNGELIKIFSSTKAVIEDGFKQSSVSQCCNGKILTHKNYIWSYEELDKNYFKDFHKSKCYMKTVYQYDNNLRLIKVWKSTRECEEDGFKQANVSKCCRGNKKQYKGYIWSYFEL